MRAYYFDKLGAGIDGLALGERRDPRPGPGEALVKIRARSLNYRDLRILTGLYPVPGRVGLVALSDGAGEVVALGEGVSRVAIGDRVAATYFPQWIEGRFSMAMAADQFGCTRDGVLAQLLAVSERALIKVPSHLSFEEAATLPCAALTAWSALLGPRPILPRETVLTIGTGGVALFALQFAKLFGARVVAITSTDAKAERLRQLGADEVVNYRSSPEWHLVVRERTGGRGVDHVVETGGLDTMPRSIAAAAEEGVVTLVAALGQGNIDARTFANPVIVRRVYVGSRTHFEAMNQAIAAHKLRPVIDRTFGFDEARRAYQHFEARAHIGKVVIAGD
ncbi:NAD(P)-dependent alcohol dehydrogenase [Methylocapsa sp. S129]|uniref:zinc-dependent alcohol dehydrogenase family protein n=1 Tax=Methylocapsa sp. S129 TaxID=1641869 RepID=UPI00131CFC77|nr:NAD(P)-dependent alcohol dehydrogenase [Methylocapsa sp. S129]